ncbi:MAG TPA: hypothetical protein PLE48_07775 [Thiobacillus sp.]|nr:MAG: hypothetical protein B7Y50_02650 [Hydrogenophilales bacterium 28-61-11]OYZ57316.1 MAG: hypothetical protein B7Y21_07965 [Hydrogenophilales bacterium 16-61-112]OZA50386.1 MAG: hypothetical protein B7X81_01485 [Hydrogenophilales bacterium 17-61-76]HQT31758.1 hypothetical protein [Thiobacillus sp.]HQT70308.1 hypothetical protein [Thiobacillus sp.]
MNTFTQTLFNALSFANVSNLHELETRLRQLDIRRVAGQPEQARTPSPLSARTAMVGPMQGAA